MNALAIPQSRIVIYCQYSNKHMPSQNFNDIGDGEVIAMSQQQLEQVRGYIGDGQASVTMSSELSESDYGTGLKVFCSIRLTCDQSAVGIDTAAHWAAAASEHYALEHFGQFKGKLIQQGLLK